jgi:hypothetical protein
MGNYKALKTIIKEQQEKDGSDRQSAVRDLLTDVRHLCDNEKIDFYEALRGSYDVYLEEKKDQNAHGEGWQNPR